MASFLRAIREKCRDCMGNYADGRVDCQVSTCALHPFMPYRVKSPEENIVKRETKPPTDAQIRAREKFKQFVRRKKS